MNPRRVTLKDIARKLGVSHTTVAMSLRNDERITPGRREQVKRAAAEMGYEPDPFLAGLAAYRRERVGRSFQGVIAWVNHWNPPARLRSFREFEAYWNGAVAAGKQHGYLVEEIVWPKDCTAKALERILIARGIRGLLIPPHHELLDWGDFDWSRFSVIRFGLSVPAPDTNLITSDHFRAMLLAVTKIHEHGYRRIGLIVDGEFNDRLGGSYHGGFRWAQEKLKLKPALPPLLVCKQQFSDTPTKAANALRRWLARHRPDAILTSETYIPGILRKLGYQIPRDLAVAGTSICDIPVDAGINQQSETIGRLAVETLIKQLHVNERGQPAHPTRILVESTWNDGQSLPRRS